MDKYYLGADIGTENNGWAATDENYNLLRLKGKTAWGTRVFSEAKSCKERRTFRSNKRRINRRKYRIHLLNSLFAEEISKIDSTFFVRLSNSSFVFEDKPSNISKYLLFKDSKLEKDFYKKYPTIWHLRNALINDDKDAFSDLRNVYLAIHHIIKYRGNFLKDGTFDVDKFDYANFNVLNDFLKEIEELKGNENEIEVIINERNGKKIIAILEDNSKNKTEKQKEIKKLFNFNLSKDYVDLFSRLVTGGNYSLKAIVEDSEEKITFVSNYDENEDSYRQLLAEDFVIVEIAKSIYDHVELRRLLKENSSISEVMINVYNEHNKDLKLLKKVLINIDKKLGNEGINRLYHKMFKQKDNEKNYAAFVHVETDKSRPSIEDFNKYVISLVEPYKDMIKEEYDYIVSKCEEGKFLSIIANVSTSLIPHQLHLLELEEIIDNAAKYYSFIKDIKQKLIVLFKFRVPYYYGPLDSRSSFAWVERVSNEKVTPWNIKDIIDDSKTREKFVKRLTNKCKYLANEDVLPKSSLYYEEYMVLDKLNALVINGNHIGNDLKIKLFNFIINRKSTTLKQVKGFLEKEYPDNKSSGIIISGIDETVPFKCESHALFSSIYDLKDYSKYDVIERIILLATVYADDKNQLEEVLKLELVNEVKDVKKIKTLNTKKWAPFSKKLLTGIRCIKEGQSLSILDLLKSTNMNFQQILNHKEYGFLNEIKKHNDEFRGIFTKKEQIEEILDSMPSATRRMVNQLLAVYDDVVSIKGYDPEKIFVEVTRRNLTEAQKKKAKKDSRRKELETFLKSFKNDLDEYKRQAGLLTEELKNEISSDELKGKHIYLYFKQLGYDMYTGEKIDIDDVLRSDKYDIDHIIPQSLRKDDSLDNMVLVNRFDNQVTKGDRYPLPEKLRNEKTINLWKFLLKKGAISEKKYNALIKTSALTEQEIEDFINRQINFVDYANIGLRDILNIKYPNTKIVFAKSQYASLIRKELEIAKCRDLNDAHHAVDAYLNIVAGNILSTHFAKVHEIYEEKVNNKNSKYTFNLDNVLLSKLMKNGDELTELGNKVKENSLRRNQLVTFRNEYHTGNFYKQTIYKAEDGGSLIPIHTNNAMKDITKYGGYLELKNTSLLLVKVKKNKKVEKMLIGDKLLYSTLYKDNPEKYKEVLININCFKNIDDIEIIRPIYNNQKIIFDGKICLLQSCNLKQIKLKNAYQMYMDNEDLLYLNKANKNLDKLDVDDNEVIFKGFNRKNNSESIKEFTVSKAKNLNLFNKLINMSNHKNYEGNSVFEKCKSFDINIFNTLSLKDQIECLFAFIKVFSRGNEQSTINKYYTGIGNLYLLKSINITKNKVQLICESPSGLFAKRVEL